jgi:hypothetical protein
MLVINYDEWGGFFDHVPPSVAPDARPEWGLRGFRVPCLVISPRARRGHVAHDVYDHTSILKAIEWRWNLPPLTPRDEAARNIAEVLDFTRAVAAPFGDERPRMGDARAFAERWGEQLTPELVGRIERLGLVRPLGDGRYEVRSPRLERAAQELADLGVRHAAPEREVEQGPVSRIEITQSGWQTICWHS